MRLNPSNELVQAVYAFIGQKVEEVRRKLADAERQRRAGEEARKLKEQAEEIARVINEDFDAFRQRIAKAKAKAVGGLDHMEAQLEVGKDADDLLFGSELPAEVTAPISGPGVSDGGDGPDGPPDVEPPDFRPRVTPGSPEAEKKGRLAGGTANKPKPRGGFQVRFEPMGIESYRAVYIRDERTIYVNLDHPQLAAAQGAGSVEDPVFRRLAYEVAFCEYAVALASELAARDEYLDPSDPIVDIRETLNRVARKGASLYSLTAAKE